MKESKFANQNISLLYQYIRAIGPEGIRSGAGDAIYLEPEWQLWFRVLKFHREYLEAGERDHLEGDFLPIL